MNIFKKKNKLIYIFLVAIFASVTTTPSISKAYSVEEVELKRDLIEELKSKYNLDPENNPKDQCDLMFELRDYIVGYATERPNESSLCEKNGICLKALSIYNFSKKKQLWGNNKYNYGIIYRKSSHDIIGIFRHITEGYDEEVRSYIYHSKDMYVLTDVRYHDKYNILKSQKNKIFIQGVKNDDIGFSKFNSNKKKGSYLKSRGCYVEGFHIANEYKELFL